MMVADSNFNFNYCSSGSRTGIPIYLSVELYLFSLLIKNSSKVYGSSAPLNPLGILLTPIVLLKFYC